MLIDKKFKVHNFDQTCCKQICHFMWKPIARFFKNLFFAF